MNVEYTGRHTTVPEHLKARAEEALQPIFTMLGRSAGAHVILTEDKYRMIAEITVTCRGCSLVATCQGTDMAAALHDALAKIEQQAIRHRQKSTTLRRHPKDNRTASDAPASETAAAARPLKKAAARRIAVKVSAARKAGSMVVHSFPAARNGKPPVVEPHVVRSIDSAAMRPMTFEEAVKEAATRDRDVFVFRDHTARVMVLHRKRDGRMELIEVP